MIPYVLAVVACCLGGALGGFTLMRPREALALRGLAATEGSAGGLATARSYGAMMIVAHAGTAGLLGYYPPVGASMALALGLLWAGSAVGRLISGLIDGPADSAGIQTLLVEVLMGLALSLPFWASRQISGGPTMSV